MTRKRTGWALAAAVLLLCSCMQGEQIESQKQPDRGKLTMLEIEEGKIYCVWGTSGHRVNNIPSCVFVPRKGN